MKVRLHRDSLRLRLTPDDVERLTSAGSVRETTGFGPASALTCTLRRTREIAEPAASFDAGGITVSLPDDTARAWAAGDAVGIRHEQPIGPGRSLAILVEKDFECLDAPSDGADETYFPNPKKACG